MSTAPSPPLPPDRWAGAPVRYPDPAVRVLDQRFQRHRIDSAAVERLTTGYRWTEGPVWFGDHRCLLFSDIPNNRIMRWDERSAEVGVFRAPSDFANGGHRARAGPAHAASRGRSGRLLSCEPLPRRGPRTEHDGRVTVLADTVEAKRLNA